MTELNENLENILKYFLFGKRRILKICLYVSLMGVTLFGTSLLQTNKALYVHIPGDDDLRLNEVIPPSQVTIIPFFNENFKVKKSRPRENWLPF
jgi:hypothetical protein